MPRKGLKYFNWMMTLFRTLRCKAKLVNTFNVVELRFLVLEQELIILKSQFNKHIELPLELSTLEMETLQDSKLFTLQEVKFKKLETKMLEIFDKAKKNLIDETWLLITLMEDEYELLLKTFVTKWKKISKVVMNVGSFQCPQNGLA